jgi:2-dehydropantoate 2-reductase
MRERGVQVRGEIGEFVVHPNVTDDPATVGVVEVVILSLKAHSLVEFAPKLTPLLGPETTVVSAQNGLPWWYFYRHGGGFDGFKSEAIDPGGVIGRSLPPSRAVGCVIYCSTSIEEPGVIEHLEGTRFALGEPDHSKSERCRRIADAFIRSGLRAPVRADIRRDIWVKLVGSLAFNPLSAITRATLGDIVKFPPTRLLAHTIMLEGDEVARRLGIEIGISPEQRLAGAEKVGPHRTSMLQDLEAGRPLELDPIVGAVIEIAAKLNIPVPQTETVYACAKLLERQAMNK